MPYQGEIQHPNLIFWSGDDAFYLRDVVITKRDKVMRRIYMIPTEFVIWRYNIDSRDKSEGGDLDFSLETGHSLGVMVREYPDEHFHDLSRNPEHPMILVTCNFDGTEAIGHELVSLSNKITWYQNEVLNMKAENARLREEYKISLERIKALET